jgi:hypothetical protein
VRSIVEIYDFDMIHKINIWDLRGHCLTLLILVFESDLGRELLKAIYMYARRCPATVAPIPMLMIVQRRGAVAVSDLKMPRQRNLWVITGCVKPRSAECLTTLIDDEHGRTLGGGREKVDETRDHGILLTRDNS